MDETTEPVMHTYGTKPWTLRILKLLRTGPQLREIVVTEAMGTVPPGIAWRERERMRKWQADYKGLSPPPSTPDEDAIRAGRRYVTLNSLFALLHSGRVEKYIEDGKDMLRLGREQQKHTTHKGSPRRESSLRVIRALDPSTLGAQDTLNALGWSVDNAHRLRLRDIPASRLPYTEISVGSRKHRRYRRDDIETYRLGRTAGTDQERADHDG